MPPSSPPPPRSPAPFLLTSFSPLLLITFSLLLLIALLTLSPRAQAEPRISPEQAIALALDDVVPVGENFRISDMGGDVLYDAGDPDIAYNSIDNEYLVVWSGDDNTGNLVDGEAEIFGQRVDAITGMEIGGDFRISNMGPDGNVSYGAYIPAVAYNVTGNEYLVVWYGNNPDRPEIFGQRIDGPSGAEIGNDFQISQMTPNGGATWPAIAYNSINNQYLVVWTGDTLWNGENEIFGQRLDAATGAEIGANDFRISDMGPDGDPNFDGLWSKVAYNSTENEYFVTWDGDDNSGVLVDDEFEIFGQRIDAPSGAEIGGDFRISDMGPNGDPNYDAYDPAITYQPTGNEYLVVWHGDDNTGGLVNEEFEIFGQRLDAATGEEIGNDFGISNLWPAGNPSDDSTQPVVSYNNVSNEYLVVWTGENETGGLGDGELEIYGQRLDATTGIEIGPNDFRLSDAGPDGNGSYWAFESALAYNSIGNEYLVVWQGDDNINGLVNDEYEIFAQRLDSTGTEIGADDFRISDMGGDVTFDAYLPKAAFNPTNYLYLVVWQGDDNTGLLLDDEFEIFGQLIDAITGEDIGGDFRISNMGPDGNALYDAYDPDLAYNPDSNEFLVIWQGDDNTSPLIEDEYEIFGQRLNAATGAEIGPNDFRISNVGPDGNALYDAWGSPDVVYNPTEDEYLVVWFGDPGTGGMVDNEREIFGQRLEGDSGAEIGADFRISDMGGDGNISFVGDYPEVAYNSVNNEYLVVWHGDDNVNGLVDEEYEIFGQRLNAATGAEVGENDFRISDMGDPGPIWEAYWPALDYNSTNNEFLVVWSGEDSAGELVDEEYEIFGQRLNAATGAELGENDFRISDMGPDGNTSYRAHQPSTVYMPGEHEYMVVWSGEDSAGGLVDEEYEIFGQRLDAATGMEIGENDFRISEMGGIGVANYVAYYAAIIYSSTQSEYLVVWSGDDNNNGLVDEEWEIFGQRLQIITPTPTPTPTPTNTPTPPPASTPGPIYLPLAIRPILCFTGSEEVEPNDSSATATGPLCLNQNYLGTPDDNWDYFSFTLNSPGQFTIDVTNHPLATENGAQLLLYYQAVSSGNQIGDPDVLPPYQITHDGAAGTYYIVLYNDIDKCNLVNCSMKYTLRVSK